LAFFVKLRWARQQGRLSTSMRTCYTMTCASQRHGEEFVDLIFSIHYEVSFATPTS